MKSFLKKIFNRTSLIFDKWLYNQVHNNDGEFKDPELASTVQDLLTYRVIQAYSLLETEVRKRLKDISTNTDIYVFPDREKDIKLFVEFEHALNLIKHPNERKLRHLFLADLQFLRLIRNSVLHNDGDATKDIRYYAERNPHFLKINKFNKVVMKEKYIDYIYSKLLEFSKLYSIHKGKVIEIENNRASTDKSLTEEEATQIINDLEKLKPELFEEKNRI
ncbi:MAG: hypothetical protein QG570_209 [Patescibacteria group bacterium]|nr:hypothetical protein [Patescibacteria group bacterium]